MSRLECWLILLPTFFIGKANLEMTNTSCSRAGERSNGAAFLLHSSWNWIELFYAFPKLTHQLRDHFVDLIKTRDSIHNDPSLFIIRGFWVE